MMVTGNDDNAGGEGRDDNDNCRLTSADNKQQSTYKGSLVRVARRRGRRRRGDKPNAGEEDHDGNDQRLNQAQMAR
jgi:hypothetical protein